MNTNLIYDVGLNHGEDTEFYLAKGFRVVAIEADPALAEAGSARFRKEIAEGRLTVLNVGVGPTRGRFDFYVNEHSDGFSSFVREVGTRDNSKFHVIQVDTVPFRDILQNYGVPYYLKTDIERHDIYCLLGLDAKDLPRYVSVEAHELEYLCILSRLGYNAFKCVDQTAHNHGPLPFHNENPLGWVSRFAIHNWRRVERRVLKRTPSRYGRHFPFGSSGPLDSPGEWRTLEDVAYDWLHLKTGHKHRGTLNPWAWFDFHATILD